MHIHILPRKGEECINVGSHLAHPEDVKGSKDVPGLFFLSPFKRLKEVEKFRIAVSILPAPSRASPARKQTLQFPFGAATHTWHEFKHK